MARRSAASRDRQRLTKLLRICEALPEVVVSGAQHRAFRVRKKTFAYYLNDHHGDGIIAISFKASFEDQSLLVENEPELFYVPAYVGARGWVAMRLDLPRVDWELAKELIFDAYRLQAPRRLATQVA